MKKCALYARVSTPEQHVENQLCDLRTMAAQRGFEIVGEFTDIGISGSKARRPGLDALMKDARKKKFSVVCVAAFDRMARSTRHFLQVVDELDSLGVEFISRRENVDTSGAMGRLFLTMISSISELESDLIRERIRSSLRRRKLEGFRLGRQPLDINHGALVYDRLNGMSLTDTAKKYGVSRASVVRFVRVARHREMSEVGGLPVEQQPKSTVECVA
jgi:DNA invertase Pin-like site-specific DNA recombinase